MRRCKKQLRWCAVCVCLLIALPFSAASAAAADLTPAGVAQRIAGLYSNLETIKLLSTGEIPTRWQGELDPFMNGDGYFSYQCRSDRMALWLWLDEESGGLDLASLEMLHRINSDGTLEFTYDTSFEKDAALRYTMAIKAGRARCPLINP